MTIIFGLVIRLDPTIGIREKSQSSILMR